MESSHLLTQVSDMNDLDTMSATLLDIPDDDFYMDCTYEGATFDLVLNSDFQHGLGIYI